MSIIKTSVYFDIDPKLLRGPCSKAEKALAWEIEKDTRLFVPASGAPAGMMNTTRVDGNQIIYPGPYAKFLYHGKVMVDPNTGSPFAPKGQHKVLTDKDLSFSDAVNPQPQAYWFEASKAQNMEKWERSYKKAVEENL